MIRDSVDKNSLPVLNDENAFKLGIFGFNMRGGVTMADLPGMVQGNWDESVRYAQWADRIDLDACVPIARWRGYGGEKNLGDRSFETFTWATGLLCHTERIQVFATYHVPLGHPVMVAKLAASADQIGGGRFGMNVVAGWNTEELAMFGLSQREHDERYVVADEWARAIKQLWTETGENDFKGDWFDIPKGFSEPKPVTKPWPTIMNAGTSAAGREFACKHSDLIFAGLTNLETAKQQIADIKQLAREQHGREIKVFGRGHIVCRDTEEEAKRRWDEVHHDLADVEGARNVVRINVPNSQSADWESMKMKTIVDGMIAGFWSLPLCGTPDQIAETMIDLHAAGLDGMALSWPDFDEGLDQLEHQILPLLAQAGLRRTPPRAAAAATPAAAGAA